MKWFHIPKLEWMEGTLLNYELIDGEHYPRYSFCINGAEIIRVDGDSIEKLFDDDIVGELLSESMPKQISVAYDEKNIDDSKPDLLNTLE